MVHKIIKLGDPCLKTASPDIQEITDEIKELIANLKNSLTFYDCAGLSAVQLGVNLNIFVGRIDNQIKTFINAAILSHTDTKVKEMEGCMSIPYVFFPVERYQSILVKYRDEDFNECVENFDGFNAKLIQHEVDHGKGTLILESASLLTKEITAKKIQKLKKSGKWNVDEVLLDLFRAQQEQKATV